MGERTCPMIFESDAPVMPSFYSTDYANCTTPDVAAGLYNVSLNVEDPSLGLGDALVDFNVYRARGGMMFLDTTTHTYMDIL